MADGPSFEAMKSLYFTLNDNFDDLLDACQTEDQKAQFRKSYANARDQFHAAENRVFRDDDAAAQQLCADLSAARQQVEDSLTNLQEIVAVLGTIDSAVQLGTRLLAMAAIA
jgi:uncharacterized protein (DUF3084 family)